MIDGQGIVLIALIFDGPQDFLMFVHDNTSFLVLFHGPVSEVHLALTANVVFATKHFAGGLEGVLEGLEIPVELVALAGGAGGGGGGHIC